MKYYSIHFYNLKIICVDGDVDVNIEPSEAQGKIVKNRAINCMKLYSPFVLAHLHFDRAVLAEKGTMIKTMKSGGDLPQQKHPLLRDFVGTKFVCRRT